MVSIKARRFSRIVVGTLLVSLHVGGALSHSQQIRSDAVRVVVDGRNASRSRAELADMARSVAQSLKQRTGRSADVEVIDSRNGSVIVRFSASELEQQVQ